MVRRSLWCFSIFFLLMYCENCFCDSLSSNKGESEQDPRNFEVDKRIASIVKNFVFVWEGCLEYDSYSWCKAVDDSERLGKKEMTELMKKEFSKGNVNEFMSLLDRIHNADYMMEIAEVSNSNHYSHAYTSIIRPVVKGVLSEYGIEYHGGEWSDIKQNISDRLNEVVSKMKAQGGCVNNFKGTIE